MQQLNGKTAVITGGSSGIGKAIAALFLEQGAKVAIIGRDRRALEAVPGVLGVSADVRDPSALRDAMNEVQRRLGTIDVVVANAGLGRFAPLEATTTEAFDEVFDTNVKGLFFTVQASLPYLATNASIVLTGSFLAAAGLANTSVLSASKAAVSSLGRTFAIELAPRGVRVNVIAPGFIATPFVERSGLPADAIKGLATGALASIPFKRFGTPEEIARVALFLASAQAAYVTGAEVVADGGILAA
jgi:NAD(P)-dependent dehydrogenase (short-subunit alcohol dehydrogenase family)